jgi:hypothetical protein
VTRIPIASENFIVGFCTAEQAVLLYAGKPNAQLIRKRKTGEIVRVQLSAVADDDSGRRSAAHVGPTYNEPLACGAVTVLSVIDSDTGSFRRWDDKDSFNPKRFNPDRVPGNLRQLCKSANIR